MAEKQFGLASKLRVKCQFCPAKNSIETSSMHKSGKFGAMAYDINTKAALACFHTGIGRTHLNSAMSILNIPPMSRTCFKTRERETGKAVEKVAHLACKEVTTNEKKHAIPTVRNNLIPVPCSYDMGWQKRGKGFNSNTGQGAVMELCHKKQNMQDM